MPDDDQPTRRRASRRQDADQTSSPTTPDETAAEATASAEASGPEEAEARPAGGEEVEPADADDEPIEHRVTATRPRTDVLDPLVEAVRATGAFGRLVLHYPERDVTFTVDGETAMRVLTMLVRRRDGGLGDPMSPSASPAAAWFVFDLGEPLAASWTPGMPMPPRRTAVDPNLPDAA